jgi:lysyl-tRNA synthetase class 2
MNPAAGRACPGCGRETTVLRDGVCLACWYQSTDRPKPVRDRFAKLERLREQGVEPYAYSYDPSHQLADALTAFEMHESKVRESDPDPVRVAGRVLSFRDLGGSAFAHLGDRSGRLQIYFKRDALDELSVRLLEHIDLGDWIGVEGPLFRTRTGEATVRVEGLALLSKTLRPLPFGKEEVSESGERVVHSGFSDVESRYRQRYADLAVNPEVRELFTVRAGVVSACRRWLDDRGFLEVETPVLQPLYGGALARPFTTHHNALDTQLYLRIADELYLKRLIVGTLDRVYEIGKNFRNEGVDRTHNPEFTMLELYQAYADYEAMMDLAEELVTDVLREVCGSLELHYGGRTVDFSRPWARLSFAASIEKFTDIDILNTPESELVDLVRRTGREDAGELAKAKLLDALFSAVVEPELARPTIIYDYPVEMSPLAKRSRGNPAFAERFEVIAMGSEIVNAFSELNDPVEQWARFAEQARHREAGDVEAHGIDEDYVRALEYGLPPTGGLGMGVDRLVMLATNSSSVRDVILFPILRPEEGE